MEKTTIADNKLEIFSTIIPLETRVRANKFRNYQSQPSKGKQVYLNTLAVYAVNSYLNSLGWSTNLKASDSHNPVFQTMMDTADLYVPSYGKLECRFVMMGEDKVTIPPEVWTDRIGYIVVRLEPALERADVLGFVRQVAQSSLPLNQLESLADFPAYLSLKKLATPSETATISNWLSQQFDLGWHRLEELFAPAVALNFRSPQNLTDTPNQLSKEVNRVKLVQFKEDINIALVLSIQSQNNSPKNMQRSTSLAQSSTWRSPQEFNISMVVCNSQFNNLLPLSLELIIFDQDSYPVMIAQANETKTIEFCFSGKLGESFSIELALEEQIQTESFII